MGLRGQYTGLERELSLFSGSYHCACPEESNISYIHIPFTQDTQFLTKLPPLEALLKIRIQPTSEGSIIVYICPVYRAFIQYREYI